MLEGEFNSHLGYDKHEKSISSINVMESVKKRYRLLLAKAK